MPESRASGSPSSSAGHPRLRPSAFFFRVLWRRRWTDVKERTPLAQRGIDLGGCRAAVLPGQIAAVVVDGREAAAALSPISHREARGLPYVHCYCCRLLVHRAVCRQGVYRRERRGASFECTPTFTHRRRARGRFVDCCLDCDRRRRSTGRETLREMRKHALHIIRYKGELYHNEIYEDMRCLYIYKVQIPPLPPLLYEDSPFMGLLLRRSITGMTFTITTSRIQLSNLLAYYQH